MKLLGIGVVLLALVLAMAVLFSKVDRLDEKIKQGADGAREPRLELLAGRH